VEGDAISVEGDALRRRLSQASPSTVGTDNRFQLFIKLRRKQYKMEQILLLDSKQLREYNARKQQQSTVAAAMNSIWGRAPFGQARDLFSKFWDAWRAYGAACATGDTQNIELTGDKFDEIATECARFVSSIWTEIFMQAKAGMQKSLAASDACMQVSQLRRWGF
jgi:hypothetical protein